MYVCTSIYVYKKRINKRLICMLVSKCRLKAKCAIDCPTGCLVAWWVGWRALQACLVCVAHARQYFRHTVSMPASVRRKHLTIICKKSGEKKNKLNEMKSKNAAELTRCISFSVPTRGRKYTHEHCSWHRV